MTETRNRISKYDSLEDGITTMEGNRDALTRNRYYQQAEQMNTLISLAYTFQVVLNNEEKAEETQREQ